MTSKKKTSARKNKGSPKLAYLANHYFGNRCAVTLAKFKPTGFVIHHLEYSECDVERKNYSEGPVGTEEYYSDLELEIMKRPYDFILIKNSIHTKIDHFKNGIARLKRNDKIRLCAYVLLTEKRDRK